MIPALKREKETKNRRTDSSQRGAMDRFITKETQTPIGED